MPKFKDLKDERFGRWTVLEKSENKNGKIYWKCVCECGNTKDVCGAFLISGRSKSCGCLTIETLKKRAGDNIKDIVGNRYGKLTVIEAMKERYSNGSVKWKCICDCGKIYFCSSSELKRRKSCGCETRLIDLTGKKFGRLTVMRRTSNKKTRTYWHCKCDCGKEIDVCASHLSSSKTVSCGCSSAERIAELNKTHGMSKTILYKKWCEMKKRCFNKSTASYSSYGGRGITVCDEWKDDFLSFYNWAMSNGYSNGLSIDRIDVNGNYEPSNCRWVDNKTQSLNKRNTIYIELFGAKTTLFECCEYAQVDYKRAYRKYKNGKQPFNESELMRIEEKLEYGGI